MTPEDFVDARARRALPRACGDGGGELPLRPPRLRRHRDPRRARRRSAASSSTPSRWSRARAASGPRPTSAASSAPATSPRRRTRSDARTASRARWSTATTAAASSATPPRTSPLTPHAAVPADGVYAALVSCSTRTPSAQALPRRGEHRHQPDVRRRRAAGRGVRPRPRRDLDLYGRHVALDFVAAHPGPDAVRRHRAARGADGARRRRRPAALGDGTVAESPEVASHREVVHPPRPAAVRRGLLRRPRRLDPRGPGAGRRCSCSRRSTVTIAARDDSAGDWRLRGGVVVAFAVGYVVLEPAARAARPLALPEHVTRPGWPSSSSCPSAAALRVRPRRSTGSCKRSSAARPAARRLRRHPLRARRAHGLGGALDLRPAQRRRRSSSPACCRSCCSCITFLFINTGCGRSLGSMSAAVTVAGASRCSRSSGVLFIVTRRAARSSREIEPDHRPRRRPRG